MISAHNGHTMKAIEDGEDSFGKMLSNVYGAGYFSIGTDFFYTNDNINTSHMHTSEYIRKNHRFCSADTLAYQAKYMKNKSYYLDFSKVTEGDVYDQIHKVGYIGNIGEGYSWVWYIFQDKSIRAEYAQAEVFDSMIYVYKTTPITVTGDFN